MILPSRFSICYLPLRVTSLPAPTLWRHTWTQVSLQSANFSSPTYCFDISRTSRTELTSLYPKPLSNLTTYFKLLHKLLQLNVLQVPTGEYIQGELPFSPAPTPAALPWVPAFTMDTMGSLGPWGTRRFPSPRAPVLVGKGVSPTKLPVSSSSFPLIMPPSLSNCFLPVLKPYLCKTHLWIYFSLAQKHAEAAQTQPTFLPSLTSYLSSTNFLLS